MMHEATAVFTPTTAAKITFVERQSVNRRLVQALRTPGMQVVVFGRSGCGKTTLLANKLRQLYETEIVSSCTVDTTFDQLMVDALDKISPFVEMGRQAKSTKKISARVLALFKSIESSLSMERTEEVEATQARALPPQLNAPFLAQLLGEMNACWVIEDFHKVRMEERTRLAQVMKLFMDAANEYPKVKIIAIGAVGTARQVVDCDKEMWNRIAEIEVPLMTNDELSEIMRKGSAAMNIELSARVRGSICRFSNGLPAVCHQLCLNLCFAADLNTTASKTVRFEVDQLSKAVGGWLEDSADTLKRSYDLAVRAKRIRKFDNCRVIVNAVAHFGPEGATHPLILQKVREVYGSYPGGNLTQYLQQLCDVPRGFVFVKDDVSGRYSFASPMMHAYARVRAEARTDESEVVRMIDVDLAELLQQLLEADETMRKLFSDSGLLET
jgi:GTPase SAR1 family protein